MKHCPKCFFLILLWFKFVLFRYNIMNYRALRERLGQTYCTEILKYGWHITWDDFIGILIHQNAIAMYKNASALYTTKYTEEAQFLDKLTKFKSITWHLLLIISTASHVRTDVKISIPKLNRLCEKLKLTLYRRSRIV